MKMASLLLAIVPLCGIANAQDGKLPIIDMHLHATDHLWSKTRLCFPEPCEKAPTLIKNISELLPKTREKMNEYNVVLGVVSWYNIDEVYRWATSDSRFLTGPAVYDPVNVDFEKIRRDIKEGKIKIFGEITSQYAGYAMNDIALDSLFSIAEEFNLPALVHCGGIGGGDHFPILKGNPMTISDVIKRHPKLRIYVENAGWPFADEMIALMYTYPNVYADLSTITWVIPREAFHDFLKKLIVAGLGKRLMFGSDQMIWPEAIDLAIEAINSASFLSESQKRDIFYNNAASFLNLSKEQIASHHRTK